MRRCGIGELGKVSKQCGSGERKEVGRDGELALVSNPKALVAKGLLAMSPSFLSSVLFKHPAFVAILPFSGMIQTSIFRHPSTIFLYPSPIPPAKKTPLLPTCSSPLFILPQTSTSSSTPPPPPPHPRSPSSSFAQPASPRPSVSPLHSATEQPYPPLAHAEPTPS